MPTLLERISALTCMIIRYMHFNLLIKYLKLTSLLLTYFHYLTNLLPFSFYLSRFMYCA